MVFAHDCVHGASRSNLSEQWLEGATARNQYLACKCMGGPGVGFWIVLLVRFGGKQLISCVRVGVHGWINATAMLHVIMLRRNPCCQVNLRTRKVNVIVVRHSWRKGEGASSAAHAASVGLRRWEGCRPAQSSECNEALMRPAHAAFSSLLPGTNWRKPRAPRIMGGGAVLGLSG